MPMDTFSIHIHEPTITHTHTVIFLHSRGGSGPAIAEDLLGVTLTSQPITASAEPTEANTLEKRFPGVRWIFPSARMLWRPSIQQHTPAWFEAYSLADIEEKSELAIPGLRESVQYIRNIIDEEIKRMDGDSSRLILGGLSLGCATSYWALLDLPFALGGFVGVSGWLPFYKHVGRYLSGARHVNDTSDPDLEFVASMISDRETAATPMFIGHGLDDQLIDISFARAAKAVFVQAGHEVEWHEYTDAEMEGHWYKKPEEVDDIADFIENITQKEKS